MKHTTICRAGNQLVNRLEPKSEPQPIGLTENGMGYFQAPTRSRGEYVHMWLILSFEGIQSESAFAMSWRAYLFVLALVVWPMTTSALRDGARGKDDLICCLSWSKDQWPRFPCEMEQGGEVVSSVACFVRYTIDHTSLPRRRRKKGCTILLLASVTWLTPTRLLRDEAGGRGIPTCCFPSSYDDWRLVPFKSIQRFSPHLLTLASRKTSCKTYRQAAEGRDACKHSISMCKHNPMRDQCVLDRAPKLVADPVRGVLDTRERTVLFSFSLIFFQDRYFWFFAKFATLHCNVCFLP